MKVFATRLVLPLEDDGERERQLGGCVVVVVVEEGSGVSTPCHP